MKHLLRFASLMRRIYRYVSGDEVRGLHATIVAQMRTIEWLDEQLQEERRTFPADGLWWVSSTPGDERTQRLHYLGELPTPVEFARLAAHRDAIANAVWRSWHQYTEHGQQRPNDVADAIIHAVYAAEQDGEHV